MLILTRPKEESIKMIPMLEKLGIAYQISPLLKIDNPSYTIPNNIQSLIITSQNALKNLQAFPSGLNLYCVGEKTAKFARSQGIKTAHSAKDVQELLAFFKEKDPQAFGHILYAAAQHTTENIEEILKLQGYNIQTKVVYEAIAETVFSKELVEVLLTQSPLWISFFSARTAEIFTNLLKAHEVEKIYPCLTALCLSEKIANTLSPKPWEAIQFAEEPTLDSFWQLLKNHVECWDISREK